MVSVIVSVSLLLLGAASFSHAADCNGVEYDRAVSRCCADVVVPNPEGNNPGCCRAAALDKDTQMCCSGAPVPRPCGTSPRCCRQDALDIETHLCCSGVIISRQDGELGCCRDRAYNKETDICCGDKIVSKSESSTCCDSADRCLRWVMSELNDEHKETDTPESE